MINGNLKTNLLTAGCTIATYQTPQGANIAADQINPADIVGVVIEPTTVTLAVQGNGIHEQWPPITVEIFKQVAVEAPADDNETILNEILTIAKVFINNLVRSQYYLKIANVPCTKITEQRYDANVMGWSLSLTLKPVNSGQNC